MSIRDEIRDLSEEEAKKLMGDRIRRMLEAPPAAEKEMIAAYWRLQGHLGVTGEMREMLEGSLERGVVFYNPKGPTGATLAQDVDAIWACMCNNHGHITARDPEPMKHIVVRIELGSLEDL